MKISAKQYAAALYGATDGKSKEAVIGLIDNFVRVLAHNGHIKKSHDIIREYQSYSDDISGIIQISVTSASELDKKTAQSIRDLVVSRTGAKTVKMEVIIDPGLIGGVVIRYRDIIIDGSVNSMVKDLVETMKK